MLAISSHVSRDPGVVMNVPGWTRTLLPPGLVDEGHVGVLDVDELLGVLVPGSRVELVPLFFESARDVVLVDGGPADVHGLPHSDVSKGEAEITVADRFGDSQADLLIRVRSKDVAETSGPSPLFI